MNGVGIKEMWRLFRSEYAVVGLKGELLYVGNNLEEAVNLAEAKAKRYIEIDHETEGGQDYLVSVSVCRGANPNPIHWQEIIVSPEIIGHEKYIALAEGYLDGRVLPAIYLHGEPLYSRAVSVVDAGFLFRRIIKRFLGLV